MSLNYKDIWYQSKDGLKLHARDYAHAPDSPFTLLCMHGLTRNAADFEVLCEHLRGSYRLVVAEQRGRGRSQWDPYPANYNPSVYVGDMFALMAWLKLEQVVLIGASMGGLMAMIMGAMQPDKIRGIWQRRGRRKKLSP